MQKGMKALLIIIAILVVILIVIVYKKKQEQPQSTWAEIIAALKDSIIPKTT